MGITKVMVQLLAPLVERWELEAREVAQWVKSPCHISHKSDDLSLISRNNNNNKNQDSEVLICDPRISMVR